MTASAPRVPETGLTPLLGPRSVSGLSIVIVVVNA